MIFKLYVFILLERGEDALTPISLLYVQILDFPLGSNATLNISQYFLWAARVGGGEGRQCGQWRKLRL